MHDRDNDKDTPLGFGIVACRVQRPASYRRVWSIGRILSVIGLPEPQCCGCGAAPHFCVFITPLPESRDLADMENHKKTFYESPGVDILVLTHGEIILQNSSPNHSPEENPGGTVNDWIWED